MNHDEARLARARLSLEGLSVGDGFGQFYEYASLVRRINVPPENVLKRQIITDKEWRWTDDTNMALSIYANLRQYGEINQDALAVDFARRLDGQRGYGSGAWDILTRIRSGISWRDYAPTIFNHTGSYGNGGAMRVAPLGAYFADDIPKLIEQAKLSAEITHTHSDGIAGAVAVAVAAAVAWNMAQAGEKPERRDFLEQVQQHVPEGRVYEGITQARDLPDGTSVTDAARLLGSGYQVAAHDTVPFVLWCAGTWLDDFEEAIWQTAAGLGDVDTTCAMVGGIVAAYVGQDGIPAEWIERREPLPDWAFNEET